jgi:mannose-6-phosphate isomerase-like protein (cupin superfamily)
LSQIQGDRKFVILRNMNAISLNEKLKLFQEHWTPKKIGELNGQQVLLAKLQGEFVWHAHENEDELFMILEGSLTIEFEDHSVQLNKGELCIIPRGTLHRPVAKEEVHVLLFEPLGIKHTGNVKSDRTVTRYERI